MGFGNIGWFQILVVLLIVLLIFGTKRIRHLGSDLGGAIRDFRKGIGEDHDADPDPNETAKDKNQTANDHDDTKKSDASDRKPGN